MFAFSAISFALAIAERMHFSTWAAARFFVKRRIASAWLTSLPRIISTTSRAFCAEPRKYFALAVASIFESLSALIRVHSRPYFGGAPATLLVFSTFVSRVALERARRGKLTEL